MSLCMELPGSQEALESPPLDMERGEPSPLLGSAGKLLQLGEEDVDVREAWDEVERQA